MPLFIYENLVEENIKTIQNYTKRNLMAVVKSDAYGLSNNKMIPLLKRCGVDYFVFEKYQEYEKYQSLLKDVKVLILESCSLKTITHAPNNLSFSINSFYDAIIIKRINKVVNVHLRIDTGMNRYGIRRLAEFKQILYLLQRNRKIMIEGIYTHFATDCFESKYYEKQLKLFKKYLEFHNFAIVHANATKSLNKELIGNYVRVGIALYGYHQPFLPLKKTLSLTLKPTNIFKTTKKSKIGYQNITVKKDTMIGVIPIGYNDVDLSQIKYFEYQKQKYDFIGKSCMNHTHFIADDKINYLSWLSILPTNDIINSSDEYKINWYHILTSLKNLPKNYLRRSNYDLPKVFKYNGQKSLRTKFRTRSN